MVKHQYPFIVFSLCAGKRENKSSFTHVFDLHTLQSLSEVLPVTLEEMLQIDGVSQVKLDKYGQEFLRITLEYMAKLGCECLQMQPILFPSKFAIPPRSE